MTTRAANRYRPALRSRPARDVDALLHSALRGFPSLATAFDVDHLLRPVPANLPVEVAEKEDHYLLKVEVPGVKRDRIGLTVDGQALAIEVFESPVQEGEEASEEGERQVLRRRHLTLPESVAAEQVKASLEDGILTVTLPKLPVAKARVIEIA